MKLQRFELNTYYDHPIFCIFCGANVVNPESLESQVTPCLHTIYIAHDEGWEYLSGNGKSALEKMGFRVEDSEGVIELDHDDEDVNCYDIEGITDKILFDDGLKVACYVGPPSGMGTYIGFSPLPDY